MFKIILTCVLQILVLGVILAFLNARRIAAWRARREEHKREAAVAASEPATDARKATDREINDANRKSNTKKTKEDESKARKK